MKTTIQNSMAKAFFASSWADMMEENGISLRGEIMDQIPDEIDSNAIHAAKILIMDIERINNRSIEQCFIDLCGISQGKGDRQHNPDIFGHYAAMQSMGHGVGLYDAFGIDFIIIPYVEFSSHSLSKDY